MIALQNVKEPQAWLRIRNSKLEGNVSLLLQISIYLFCGNFFHHLFFNREKVVASVSSGWKKMVRAQKMKDDRKTC